MNQKAVFLPSAFILLPFSVPQEGLEPPTYGLAYQLRFSPLRGALCAAHLWSGLYLHHLRCSTYSLYGSHQVSETEFLIKTLFLFSSGFLGIAISMTC